MWPTVTHFAVAAVGVAFALLGLILAVVPLGRGHWELLARWALPYAAGVTVGGAALGYLAVCLPRCSTSLALGLGTFGGTAALGGLVSWLLFRLLGKRKMNRIVVFLARAWSVFVVLLTYFWMGWVIRFNDCGAFPSPI
jgi:hypothetical protein